MSTEEPKPAVVPTTTQEDSVTNESKTDVEEETPKVEQSSSSEESKEPTEEEVNQILKQVEFYFSDNNLPKDKFLWRTVQSNDEGFVPIQTIAMFNRMKKFRPLEKVVNALRKSEFLIVSENGELVKRKTPIVPPNEDEQKEIIQRSLYVKGFPVTQFPDKDWQTELETFFGKLAKINEVRLRKDITKKLKGDCFVEFASKEEAERILTLDPIPKFQDNDLAFMSKGSFISSKELEKKFRKNKPKSGKHFKGSSRGINKKTDKK